MGIIDSIRGKQVYLDTNIFIYAFEGYPKYTQLLTQLFDEFDNNRLHAVTSELTLAELLVKPMILGNEYLQKIYENSIRNSSSLSVICINRPIIIMAARLRAENKDLKLPDAIHIATAESTNCETLITNDEHLKMISSPTVVLLSDFMS